MIENDITVKMIDIPEVYKFDSAISLEMFEMLANVKNLNLFANSTVKAIIDKVVAQMTVQKVVKKNARAVSSASQTKKEAKQ